MFGAQVSKAGVAVAIAMVAVAVGTGSADATPTPLNTKHDRLMTDDGWKMELAASRVGGESDAQLTECAFASILTGAELSDDSFLVQEDETWLI